MTAFRLYAEPNDIATAAAAAATASLPNSDQRCLQAL